MIPQELFNILNKELVDKDWLLCSNSIKRKGIAPYNFVIYDIDGLKIKKDIYAKSGEELLKKLILYLATNS